MLDPDFKSDNEAYMEERTIISAMYGDDCVDIAPVKTTWGTEVESGWIGITLRAHGGKVSVQLRLRAGKKYPQQSPFIKLHRPVRLTADHVRGLLEELQQVCRKHIGEDIIVLLTEYVDNWIRNNHVPFPKAGEPELTLMEEKALREEAERAAEEAQSRAEDEQAIMAAQEEDRLLKEKIKLDDSLNKERRLKLAKQELERKRQQSLEQLDDGELASREIILDEPIRIEGHEGSWTTWNLFGGRREMLWTTYIAEPVEKDGTVDPNFVRTTMPTLWAQVIDFSRPFYLTDQGKKKVDSLVTEVRRLQITKSDHVLRVYGVKRDRTPKGGERVIVFVERPVDGGLLKSRLPSNGFDCLTAIEYLGQLVTGLAAIHKKNGTQRLFDSSYVVIDSSPADKPIVKLMGTGYAKRIIDEHKSNPFLKQFREINPSSWASPDERNHPQDYTAKRDIWNSGILFVELLLGSKANMIYGDLNSLRHNLPLPDPVYDLLDSMMHQQAKKRPTADEILERLRELEKTLKNASKKPPLSLNNTVHASDSDSYSPLPTPRLPHRSLSNGPQPAQLSQGQSRYKHDYEELEKLGQGGFGMVVKARNQYDHKVYAVKKIKLRDEDSRQVTDKEIQILSALSHKHIVRYFNCWTEDPIAGIHEETEELAAPAVDEISDPFAPPDPKNPYAFNRDSSKSLSFPPVRFSLATRRQDESSSDESDTESSDADSGEETESERPILKEDKVAKAVARKPPPDVPSSAITGTSNSDPAAFRTLYIAMEFVDNGTLRELIDGGLSEVESWRLFQEVLQALSYLHSQSVVHRDLKPSNILINGDRQAIVADFGLSTFSAATVETVDPVHSGTINLNGTKTSNIGTAAYIAPEVMSGRTYDAKADLYSLGVIFFEMNFPPMMGQERAQTINGLRSPATVFPPSWPSQREKQEQLITWLLAHDPASRPGADTVLASPLMPVELKTPAEHSRAIATLTTDRNSKPYKQLLEAIFKPPQAGPINLVTERSTNWLYDDDSDIRQVATEVWSAVIVQRLKDLCHRHGAQETYLPVLVPETKLLDPYQQDACVRLLDRGGQLVQMVACDLIAMARSAPRRHVGRRKRFHLGMEYRPSAPGRQPSRAAKLSFDIVSPLRSAAADVEMIEVVDKIIAEFGGGKGGLEATGYEFHISHETILSLILGIVPERARSQVLDACSRIGVSVSFERAKTALKVVSGVPRQIMNSIEACCVAGDFYEVRSKLDLIFASATSETKRRLKEALDEMDEIVKLLRSIQIGRRILFKPCLATNAELFRGGFMFECVQTSKRITQDVLAYGGRYDKLLEHFDTAHGPQATTYGVGMSISIDHLVKIVSKHESALSKDLMFREREDERSFGYWTPSPVLGEAADRQRCDVYVAAGAQVDLSARMKLIAELWRSGISADLQYDDTRTLEEVTTECEEQSTPFLLLPRVNKTDIKVRSILRKNEKEVPRGELCSYLRAAISEQRRIDATYASHEGSISSSQAAALSVEARPDKESDIRLILPPEPLQQVKGGKVKPNRKHRHTTKAVYLDKITGFLQSARSTLPVIAVDLPSSMLAQLVLNTNWIPDDEAWKATLAEHSMNDRKYAESIREAVRKIVKEDGQYVFWLVGVREGKEGKGFLLQYK